MRQEIQFSVTQDFPAVPKLQNCVCIYPRLVLLPLLASDVKLEVLLFAGHRRFFSYRPIGTLKAYMGCKWIDCRCGPKGVRKYDSEKSQGFEALRRFGDQSTS